MARDGCSHAGVRFPASIAAWNAPGHELPEPAGGTVPSLVISLDPGSKRHTRIIFGWSRSRAAAPHPHGGQLRRTPAVSISSGRSTTTRSCPRSAPDDGPSISTGRAGTSASVLQYTSFGETWYRGLTLSAAKLLGHRYQFLASYTLSKAEDTSTDFPSAFIPENNGLGRDPSDPDGLPIGFDPDSERGPSLQDQRHHLVLSGIYTAPYDVNVSAIIAVVSGRPYNIIAGVDLNGDGDGGTIPGPDRARTNPADPATSIERNSGTLPSQATVDVRVNKIVPLGSRARLETIFEVFNLFNRANFTDVNNVFGTGVYPSSPLPTFGQFLQTGPSRQMQLALKITF